MVAEARVVDEEIDVDFLCGKPVGEGETAVGRGEVGRENPNIEMRVEPAKVVGEFLEAVVAAGDENEARGERSELAGKFGSKPGRGSGDERVATLEKSHHVRVTELRPRSEKGFQPF
jgi:hypothetical protein